MGVYIRKNYLFMERKRKNLAGRPSGAINLIGKETKQKIATYVHEDFDDYFDAMRSLKSKPVIFVDKFTNLLKLITPRPADEDNEQERKTRETLLKRLGLASPDESDED